MASMKASVARSMESFLKQAAISSVSARAFARCRTFVFFRAFVFWFRTSFSFYHFFVSFSFSMLT
jgi:hypothetical protein